MLEFQMAKGWKVFNTLIAVGFFAGAIFLMGLVFHPSGNVSPVAVLLISLLCIFLGVVIYLESVRLNLSIDGSSLTLRRAFRTRSVLLEEIEGFRRGEKGGLYIVLNNTDKPLQIPNNLERQQELIEWLTGRYEDVDARTFAEEKERIMEDERFGTTREEREVRLKKARFLATGMIVLSVVLFFGVLIYSRPYEPGVILLFALPWAAVYMTWYFKGLMKLNSKKGSPYSSVTLAVFFSTLSLFFLILRTYHIYTFQSKDWLILLLISAVVTMAWVSGYREVLADQKKKALIYCLFFLLAAGYCYDGLIFSNCFYDSSSPEKFSVQVAGKHITRGKSTTYYLRLSPWGRFMQEKDMSVSRSFYEEVNIEDTVGIYLQKGKWNIPWYTLRLH